MNLGHSFLALSLGTCRAMVICGADFFSLRDLGDDLLHLAAREGSQRLRADVAGPCDVQVKGGRGDLYGVVQIAVPKTAPMILFHSKESIAAKLPKCAARQRARETIEKTG